MVSFCVGFVGWFLGADGLGTYFDQCIIATSCLGAKCAEGYEGVDCTSCAPRYTRLGKYECTHCPSDYEITKATFAMACCLPFVLSGLYVAVNQSKAKSQEKQGIKTTSTSAILRKIIVSGIQLNALATLMQFEFPPEIMPVIDMSSFFFFFSLFHPTFLFLSTYLPGMKRSQLLAGP